MTLAHSMRRDLSAKLGHDFISKIQQMTHLVQLQGGTPVDMTEIACFAVASSLFAIAEVMGTDEPGAKGAIIQLMARNAERVALEMLLQFIDEEAKRTPATRCVG